MGALIGFLKRPHDLPRDWNGRKRMRCSCSVTTTQLKHPQDDPEARCGRMHPFAQETTGVDDRLGAPAITLADDLPLLNDTWRPSSKPTRVTQKVTHQRAQHSRTRG